MQHIVDDLLTLSRSKATRRPPVRRAACRWRALLRQRERRGQRAVRRAGIGSSFDADEAG